MDETLSLVGGALLLLGLLAGIVAAWIGFVRLRHWRLGQTARLPALHAEMVDARQAWLQQAYAVEARVQSVSGRLETGGRDLAVFLLWQGFTRVTGHKPGVWGQAVSRLLIGRLGADGGGGSPGRSLQV